MTEYKVLVTLDGSHHAERALAYLGVLPSLGASEVLLISVVDESEDFHDLALPEAREREANLLSTYLDAVSADIAEHLGISVRTKVLRGSPAACILDEVKAFSPELMVISTHGHSGITRWRLGSVADKVIRGAACNTLVIGPKATHEGRFQVDDFVGAFKSVLVPLDGSPLAEEALPVAALIADTFDASLILVNAVPVPMFGDAFVGEAIYAAGLDHLIEAAHNFLSRAAATLNRPAETEVLVGPAAFRLEEYISTKRIDLVVMTSHGKGGFFRATLGSVAGRLIGGPAPILIVRPARP